MKYLIKQFLKKENLNDLNFLDIKFKRTFFKLFPNIKRLETHIIGTYNYEYGRNAKNIDEIGSNFYHNIIDDYIYDFVLEHMGMAEEYDYFNLSNRDKKWIRRLYTMIKELYEKENKPTPYLHKNNRV